MASTKFRNMRIATYLIIFIFFLNHDVLARHILGGELTYTCLGDDIYGFTMTAYRDCQSGGADFDSAPGALSGTLTVFEDGSVNRIFIAPAPEEFAFDLDDGPHPCPWALNLCLEKGIYQFTLSLPQNGKDYTVSYQRCCRAETITNIFNPGETGMTFTVDITQDAQELCNSSPVFKEDVPMPIACVNEALAFDLSAFDKDGNDLRYYLCAPFIGGGLNGSGQGNGGLASDPDGVAPDPETNPPYSGVTFILPNFNPLQPISGNPPVSLDEQTGILTGVPNLIGQYVFGVCVEEYDGELLLSTVKRDFQMNVVECDTTIAPCPPIVSVKELNIKNILEVFPNPASAYIDLNLKDGIITAVKLFNINRQLILENKVEENRLSIEELDTGIFILQVHDDKGRIFTKKIIKH